MVVLQHSEGIKHKVLFQEHKLTGAKINTTSLTIHTLSFSLVFLSILSTQNNISLASYLYTNSKQDNSAFKCEGGWRHAAGGWWLQVVVGGCLP